MSYSRRWRRPAVRRGADPRTPRRSANAPSLPQPPSPTLRPVPHPRSMTAGLQVPVLGVGAWSWGDRSGYWGYGKDYSKDVRAMHSARMRNACTQQPCSAHAACTARKHTLAAVLTPGCPPHSQMHILPLIHRPTWSATRLSLRQVLPSLTRCAPCRRHPVLQPVRFCSHLSAATCFRNNN